MIELIERAEDKRVQPRFVRYLIAEGVIPPPSGGRTNADYGDEHLKGIHNYLRLRDLKFSASQAKQIIRSRLGKTVPIELADGVSLHVDLARFDPDLSPADVSARAVEALTELLATKVHIDVDPS